MLVNMKEIKDNSLICKYYGTDTWGKKRDESCQYINMAKLFYPIHSHGFVGWNWFKYTITWVQAVGCKDFKNKALFLCPTLKAIDQIKIIFI